MKFLWILMLLVGVWFLASAATADGLLPSGHGVSRWSAGVLGLILVAYPIFRLKKG